MIHAFAIVRLGLVAVTGLAIHVTWLSLVFGSAGELNLHYP